MDNKQIEKILQELYKIDPTFKEDERGLKEILIKILESRPEVKIDEAFKNYLRRQLAVKSGEKKNRLSGISEILTFRKMAFVGAGLALAFIIIVPLYTYFTQKDSLISDSDSGFKISRVSDQAFGQITTNSTNLLSREEQESGFGGGGSQTIKDSSSTAAAPLIAPEFSGYKYLYTGELSLEGIDNQVLKRVWPEETGSSGVDLSRLNFGLIDLFSFTDAQVSYITLRQTGDYAYEINIDRQRGTVSLAEVWEYWYQDMAIKEIANLSASDSLSEEELITIANNFISTHRIKTTGYGQPEVLSSYYTNNISEEMSVPETVSLVYPLIINERYVYNTTGEKSGLMVNVSQRYKRVTSLTYLASQQYQASAYTLETDPAKILKMAEQGGIYPSYYGEGIATEYQLEAPQNGYLIIYKDNEELLVPALVFPVQNEESYQKNVVVPLVSGLAEDILVRPLDMPTAVEGSEPSSAQESEVKSE